MTCTTLLYAWAPAQEQGVHQFHRLLARFVNEST